MPAPANLVHQQSTTTGTGNFTLSAVNGKQSFASAFGTGVTTNVFDYFISNQGAAEWERGTGHMSASSTLVRDTVKESTNSNAAVSFSAGTKDVTCGAVAQTYLDALRMGLGLPMINGTIVASVASNILTVAIKTAAGNDPSALDPVTFYFRNSTIATGDFTPVQVTSALSITTNATGATLGTANTAPFRLWLTAFNNAGTVVLALWQSVTGGATPTALAPLNEGIVASTTGVSGSATAAGTFYTPNGTSLTSKAFRIIGYLEYSSGLTTAGTYASAPTTVQLFGPGIKKPGDILQLSYGSTSTSQSTTSATFKDSGLTASISPSSAPNLVLFEAAQHGFQGSAASVGVAARIVRGATTLQNPETIITYSSSVSGVVGSSPMIFLDAPGSTSAQTYKTQFGLGIGTGTVFVQENSETSSMKLTEIMV